MRSSSFVPKEKFSLSRGSDGNDFPGVIDCFIEKPSKACVCRLSPVDSSLFVSPFSAWQRICIKDAHRKEPGTVLSCPRCLCRAPSIEIKTRSLHVCHLVDLSSPFPAFGCRCFGSANPQQCQPYCCSANSEIKQRVSKHVVSRRHASWLISSRANLTAGNLAPFIFATSECDVPNTQLNLRIEWGDPIDGGVVVGLIDHAQSRVHSQIVEAGDRPITYHKPFVLESAGLVVKARSYRGRISNLTLQFLERSLDALRTCVIKERRPNLMYCNIELEDADIGSVILMRKQVAEVV